MALKKPAVYNTATGKWERLQPGDTLDAPQSGGDVVVLQNNDSLPLPIGTPVYNDSAGNFKRAQANALATSNCMGLVSSTSITNATSGPVMRNGILTATTAQWDAITGGTGGLVQGTTYFLDPATPGRITSSPLTVQGQYAQEIGVAMSTTDLNINLTRPTLL